MHDPQWCIGGVFSKHETAYAKRISDWSSDVCSSDLLPVEGHRLEFTYFDTGTTRLRKTLAYDAATDTIADELSQPRYRGGGVSYIGRYTGNLTDWFTISGASGVSKERFDYGTSNTANFVQDELTGTSLCARGFYDVAVGHCPAPATTISRHFDSAPRSAPRRG